ncbi:predicted protein [Sclerotinia sclerotiorum 1980 UF-70]|uniref:Uncharacterized protein n=1 Tax=Sclerotinia sclerotiorum (strain ATCC 18683 / 1980 / Ss-1) TaxID=665079 RepID=A7F2K8_SCLS1|nr:predicted protein [Sclerotinia sclerotiorum 1980 UF-70]EDN95950.1 predicted protein [Sclerotinia sclerotiorum 1980 UF-70]
MAHRMLRNSRCKNSLHLHNLFHLSVPQDSTGKLKRGYANRAFETWASKFWPEEIYAMDVSSMTS